MKVVVALGGNALLKRGEPMTADAQRANIRIAAESLARIAGEHQLVISHGNGPQVGLLALEAAAYTEVEAYPFDILGAETQGMIGYLVEQELGNFLPAEVPLATILTMVEVDPDDPAFTNPTKFVGPVYVEGGGRCARGREGLDRQGRRRVLASRRPVAEAEADLRDPPDALADRAGRGRHLRRRRWHPDDVRRGRGPAPRRRRGRDRQGPRHEPAVAGARRGPVRDGHRRRRRVRRLGHARASDASTA